MENNSTNNSHLYTTSHVTTDKYCYSLDQIEEAKILLQDKGYAVITGLLSEDNCEALKMEYKEWWGQFGEDFPKHINSIIHDYGVGHLAPTWKARLQVKDAFAALWGTKKLLTSFDGMAISEPPENGRMKFADKHCLHLDQSKRRPGLHAYQGSLYLEGQSEEDHCFQVLAESHKHFEEYFNTVTKRPITPGIEYRALTEDELKWYLAQGCSHIRIPVPQGALLLWDSRLIHDGAAPIKGRKNKEKWRFTNFISMTPAKWARPEDLALKQKYYKELITSHHWSSLGISAFKKHDSDYYLSKHPQCATTRDVLLLAGVESYDFDDGESNGPEWTPIINEG